MFIRPALLMAGLAILVHASPIPNAYGYEEEYVPEVIPEKVISPVPAPPPPPPIVEKPIEKPLPPPPPPPPPVEKPIPAPPPPPPPVKEKPIPAPLPPPPPPPPVEKIAPLPIEKGPYYDEMIMPEEIYAPEVIAPIGEEYIPPPPEKVKGEYLPPVEHGEYPPAISGYYKRNDIYYPEAPYVDEYVEEAIAPLPVAPPPPMEKIEPLPIAPPMEKVAPLPIEPIPPVAPYPVDTYIAPVPVGGGNKCSSGPVQCCESLEAGGSDKVSGVAGLLGLVLGPILGDLQVGLTCNSLLGGGSCSSQTVCCENVHTSGLIAMGCSPITIDIL